MSTPCQYARANIVASLVINGGVVCVCVRVCVFVQVRATALPTTSTEAGRVAGFTAATCKAPTSYAPMRAHRRRRAMPFLLAKLFITVFFFLVDCGEPTPNDECAGENVDAIFSCSCWHAAARWHPCMRPDH